MSEQEKQNIIDVQECAKEMTNQQRELLLAFGAGMAAQARLEAQKRTEKEKLK